MNWRNKPPQISDFDTDEEYRAAVDSFFDAIEADYEEKKNKELD